MPDLEAESDDKLLWRVRNDAGPVGAAAQAVLAKRSQGRLIEALDDSSTKLQRLTVWLIVFTVVLVVLGVATFVVTLVK